MTEERTRELIVSLLQDIAGSLRTANELRREMLGGCHAVRPPVDTPVPKPIPKPAEAPVQLAASDPAAINVKAFADACLVKPDTPFRSIPVPVLFDAYNTWCGLRGMGDYLSSRTGFVRILHAVTKYKVSSPDTELITGVRFASDAFPADYNPWHLIKPKYGHLAHEIHKRLIGGCGVFANSDLDKNLRSRIRLYWLAEAYPEWFVVLEHHHPESNNTVKYPALQLRPQQTVVKPKATKK